MKIYNTLTKKKEEFVPLEEGNIGTGLLAAVALSCGVCAPSAARFSLFNME